MEGETRGRPEQSFWAEKETQVPLFVLREKRMKGFGREEEDREGIVHEVGLELSGSGRDEEEGEIMHTRARER